MDETSLIDAYLDELTGALTVEPGRLRRILAETEDHLREGVARRVGEGLPVVEAERASIGSFGTVRTVAADFNRSGAPAFSGWAPSLAAWMLLLAAVGMLAIGLAGESAAAFGLVFDKEYVSGDIAGTTYTPARCAELMEYAPGSTTCEAAATSHHFDESWQNADLTVIGGAIAGAAGLLWRRRRREPGRPRSLGRSAFAVLGLVGFSTAGPLLLLFGAGTAAANGGNGSALYLSGGIVSMVMLAAFARPGVRELRNLAVGYR